MLLADSESGMVLGKAFLVFALILFNAFFVIAELSFVRIRPTQLDPLIAKGNRRAIAARRIADNLDMFLGATQLGITFVGLGMGAVVEPIFQNLLDPVFDQLGVVSPGVRSGVSIGFGFFVNSYLLIVIGELAPKALAIRQTLAFAMWTATPVIWFYRLAYPFVWLLNASAARLLKAIGVDSGEMEEAHSEDEVRLLVGASQQRSGGSAYGRDLVLNAMDLRHRKVRDVMRPRAEITVLNTHAGMAECLAVAERTRYSRFPLCDGGDLDRTLGVVHAKDIWASRMKAITGADLAPVARTLIYVPETARLESLLRRFLEQKTHLAMVVDEYGGTVGLVTLENVLEIVVGQIQDEFDHEKPLLQQVNEREWEVDGAMPLHDLSDLVGEPLEAEDVTTTSGWLTHKLGAFPKLGEEVRLTLFAVRVEQVDGPRVTRVRVVKDAPPEQEAEAS